MTIFWDTGLHACLIKDAAHQNGYETKARLGFTLDLRKNGRAVLEIEFSELRRTITRVTRLTPTGTYEPCSPPWSYRQLATDRERLDNLLRYINTGMPTNFTWHNRNVFGDTQE